MSLKYPPIGEFQHRMQEHGRIRLGVRGKGPYPKSIDTFRFTSPDKNVVMQIAEAYGGTVAPWENHQGEPEFEVISESSEIGVVLPPDPLSGPTYELWGKSGLIRMCDGHQFHEAIVDPTEAPPMFICYCNQHNVQECKVTLRLRVMLTDVSFGGQWVLVTHSWYAATEMPPMIALVQAVQEQGYTSATLAVTKREKKIPGQPTKKFNVPLIKPNISLQMLTQDLSGPALEGAKLLQLEQHTDQVIEAEIVDDDEA